MCRFVPGLLRSAILSGTVLLCVVGGLLVACTSSRSPEEIASDRAAVLGLWEYRASGTSVLQRGTLQIHVQDGRLKGHIQDQWRGPAEANVIVDNGHMDLTLNQVRISGRVHRGRFEAAVRDEFWDVSERGNRHSGSGSFVAERIRKGSTSDDETDFGCPSLLREQSYACSPLPGN